MLCFSSWCKSNRRKLRSSCQPVKHSWTRWQVQKAKTTKAAKEMTRLDARAERRNGANTARVWGITTVMPVAYWTKTNKTTNDSTKTGKNQDGAKQRDTQEWLDKGSKHNFNSGYNNEWIAAKIKQTTLSNLCKTPIISWVEEQEFINNISPSSNLRLPNKTQYAKKKEKEIINITKIGILNGTLPYMVADSGTTSSSGQTTDPFIQTGQQSLKFSTCHLDTWQMQQQKHNCM